MKIAFDVDNVLADIVATARDVLEGDMGLEPGTLEIIDLYDTPFRIRGQSKPIAVDHSFWDDERVISNCRVLPGAVEAVTLASDAGLHAGYITRRPESVRQLTQDWMDSISLPREIVVHVGTNDPTTTFDLCKSEACAALGATHLVDDHADEFASAHAAGISMVVVDAFIGRSKRHQILANYPSVPLVPNVMAAVQHLLERNC